MNDASRIEVELPKGFDPRKHGAHLRAHIEKLYGPGYDVQSVDMGRNKAIAYKHVELNETVVTNEAIEVKLNAALRKPSAGEQTAAKFEDANPGFYLVKFEPYLGKATLARMSDAEVRARGSIAEVIGCKPWDVAVRKRRGGGFDFTLPRYSPSKHDDKLAEVAQFVVGRPGWYVEVDASKLTGSIIPSDPPTFPPVVPFPEKLVKPITAFDKASDKERFTLNLAMGLGQPGKGNTPVTMPLDDSTALLLVGLPGSGKQIQDSTMLPVPLSERFPTGWARNDELVVGDAIYAADGSVTHVTGFTEWQTKPGWTVHFSDGQKVVVGPEHLWKARSNMARVVNHTDQPTKALQTAAKAAALRERAREFAGTGAVGTLTDIARILGYSDTSLYQLAERLAPLAVPGAVQQPHTKAWSYCMDDILDHWATPGPSPRRGRFAGQMVTSEQRQALRGRWLTGREFVAALIETGSDAEALSGDEYQKLNHVASAAKARKKQVPAVRPVTLYPVDETIMLLADEYEARARSRMELEQVVSTEQMAQSLRYGAEQRANWAVRIADAIEAPEAELPIDPWLFGAWLGDGSSHSGWVCSGVADADWMREQVSGSGLASERVSTNSSGFSAHVFTITGMSGALRRMGLLGVDTKHIPALYRRASRTQRLAVLQGLMDTDGTIDTHGNCELSLSHEPLALDALELIRSLGIKASLTTGPASYRNAEGELVECKDRHRIHFTTDQPVFRMPRKAERLPEQVRDTQRWNYVTDITVGEPVELRCIKVDHPEHLFLVEGFIPTHNSVTVQSIVVQALIKGYRLAVIDTPAKKTDFSWAKPYVHDNWWGCDDTGTSVAEALTVATLVDEEGKRMGALLNEYHVGKWQELPEDVKKANPPILVVADELANLLSKPTLPGGLTKEAKALPQFVQMAQDYLEAKLLTLRLNALVAVHRAAGMRELYLTQRPSKTEGFPPELKSLIPHRVLLGPSPSDADIAMAFRDAKRIPRIPANIASDPVASRGAGIAHLDGSDPVVIKGFYSSNEDFVALLRKHLGPGDPSDSRVRPTAAQIERCVPKANGDELDDEDADDQPLATGGRAPSGKSSEQIAREMGDTTALALMNPELSGYEKANMARNMAAGGGKTRKQREAEKQEARDAARSGDVTVRKMEKCDNCGGFINPVTGTCNTCHQ